MSDLQIVIVLILFIPVLVLGVHCFIIMVKDIYGIIRYSHVERYRSYKGKILDRDFF